jgi:hypothetical protein
VDEEEDDDEEDEDEDEEEEEEEEEEDSTEEILDFFAGRSLLDTSGPLVGAMAARPRLARRAFLSSS